MAKYESNSTKVGKLIDSAEMKLFERDAIGGTRYDFWASDVMALAVAVDLDSNAVVYFTEFMNVDIGYDHYSFARKQAEMINRGGC